MLFNQFMCTSIRFGKFPIAVTRITIEYQSLQKQFAIITFRSIFSFSILFPEYQNQVVDAIRNY